MFNRIILFSSIAILVIIYSCTEKPTEPVRDNPLDGLNPDFIPEITDIVVGYGGNQAENPVPFTIIHNGAVGAVDQMMIGQVDNSGYALNGSWQSFDTTATLSFTGSIGNKWLAAKVRALNGNESAVHYKSFTLGMNSPSSLTAQGVSETSISLSWGDNSSIEQGYRIERKESGGVYSEIATVGQNVATYTDNGLTAWTTYYYRVRAYNSQGNSGYSNEVNGTASITAPTNLSLSLASLSQLDLSWEDNSAVEEGYKIERKTVAGGSYSQVAVLGTNAVSYNDTGLQENQTYYYRVRAYAGGNNSSYSNEASGTTTYTAGYEQTFALGTTGETIEMVWIPAGSFMLGRYSGEQGSSSNEDDQHLVTLDYGFWLGKYEVTQGQWEAVTGSNPSHNYGVGADYPVYYVSWNMITNDFIDELNDQTAGEPWRLPSESEWEYSCRAGTETRFYWDDDLSETLIDDYAVYYLNDPGGTAEVGSKLPNAWNLYDMSGNVYEWVEDYWHSNYTGSPTNGDPWLSPSSSYRVLRGGSWLSNAYYCRSAYRNYNVPSSASLYYGFRIVFSP